MENNVQPYQLAAAAGQSKKEGKYWLNKLSGHLTKSFFPYDFKKEGLKENNRLIQVEKFKFPGILYANSMKLGGGADVKLHMILVTGLVILLNKYSGSDDIMIGSPILKQDIETEFINKVLVFSTEVKNDISFKELLLEIRETIIQANKNQNYPMERVLDRLNIPMKGNEFPLFDVVIILENLYDKRFIQPIHYNIGFSFLRTGESIEGVVEYNSLLYRESTIKQIIRHYLDVLDQVLTDVNILLSDIRLLSGKEREQVLFTFNSKESAYPPDKTLPRLFEEQAAKTPDSTALTKTNRYIGLTYKELDEIAAQLAALLKSKGVAPDSIAAVMVEPSLEMIISILAILKAGGAYLPIEPDYPEERIHYMLADSRAKVLVTTSSLIEEGKQVRRFEGKKILLDKFFEIPNSSSTIPSTHPQLSSAPADAISSSTLTSTCQVGSDNLAYIIYTSGTTGRPKGVMVEHKNVVAYLHAFYREFAIKPEDTAIQLASYAFDVSIEELFPLLLRGGKVVIPDVFEMMDVYVLCRVIAKYRVNIVDCTPLLLNELNRFQANNPIENFLATVHTFISGGDVLKKDYVDHLEKIGQVYNTYGPTEATVCAAYYRYSAEDKQSHRSLSIPIGSPIANYKIYILDDNHNPVPIGVTGELSIGGPGVTRGYLNHPELTAEKFDHDLWDYRDYHDEKQLTINNSSLPPIPPFPHSPIYRTGDLARWLPDGNIEFSGRKDQQVKIRGYRIETGEIENRLLKRKEIRESIVMVRAGNEGDKYLCAYVILDKKFDLSELKEFLALQLPDYMIPAFFVQVEQFPLTPNGKIDGKALPEPQVISRVKYVAPQNPMQEKMQEVWQELLGLELIGINDNFFDIGGHSIKAIQLIAKTNQENLKLSLQDIFKYPTIAGLSDYIILEKKGDPDFLRQEKIDEEEVQRQNQAFEPENYPYYFPCLLGIIREKIRYEQHYDLDKSIFLTANGSAILGLGYKCHAGTKEKLKYTDYPFETLTGFPSIQKRLGYKIKRRVFPSLQEQLEYCEENLNHQELILLTGTTYFLNYTPDYYLDEAQWMEKMNNLFTYSTTKPGHYLAHSFILAAITKDSYIVADSIYNYYGKVPKEDFHKAVKSNRAIEFSKGHVSYDAYPSYEVLELDTNQLKTYNNNELELEILKKTAVDSLDSKQTKYKSNDTKYVAFIGLKAIKELDRIIEDCIRCEDKHNDLLTYVTQITNAWKYRTIFLRDTLQDFSKHFVIPGKTIPGIQNAIQQWDRLYNDLDMNKENKNKFPGLFEHSRQQLEKIHNEQERFYSELLETIHGIEKG